MKEVAAMKTCVDGAVIFWTGSAVVLATGLLPAVLHPALADDAPKGRPLVHGGGVETVAIQPTGRWLVTGGSDGTAGLWDLQAADPPAKPRFVLRGHAKAVARLAVSPNGRWLATGSLDETVRVWDLEAKDPGATSVVLRGYRPALWPRGPVAGAITFSPNSRRLLTAFNEIRTEQVNNRGWRGRLWDLGAADPATTGVVLEGSVQVALGTGTFEGVSPNGRWAVTGSVVGDGPAVRVWDLDAGQVAEGGTRLKLVAPMRRAKEAIVPEISPDGRWLFARTGTKAVDEYRLWEVKSGRSKGVVMLTRRFPAPARAGGFSPDGRWLALAVDLKPHDLLLWDLRAEHPEKHATTLRGHSHTVRELAFSPDGRWMATAGDDATVRLWDLRAEDPTTSGAVIVRGSSDILLFAPNSRRMVTGEREKGHLHVWDLKAPGRAPGRAELRIPEKTLKDVVVSTDGRWVVTRSADKTARLWDLGEKDRGR